MKEQIVHLKKSGHKAAVAVVIAATVFWAANPSFARLDELILEDAPYVSPPAVTVAAPQSFYVVKAGDTLWDIAEKNGLSVETLAAINGLMNQDQIKAGQALRLPSSGRVHHVQPGETVSDIAVRYGSDVTAIAERNQLSDINSIVAGRQLVIPSGTQPVLAPPSRGAEAGSFAWPLVGTITSPFGLRDGRAHEGIDIAAEEGAPIRATAPGKVVFAGPRGTYGLTVIIDHGNGMRTLYAHCSRVMVTAGSQVSPATVIALAGNTGRSNGPHLHLEVLREGVPLDPLNYLERERYYA